MAVLSYNTDITYSSLVSSTTQLTATYRKDQTETFKMCVCECVCYSLSPQCLPIPPRPDQRCYSWVLALASSPPYTVTHKHINNKTSPEQLIPFYFARLIAIIGYKVSAVSQLRKTIVMGTRGRRSG